MSEAVEAVDAVPVAPDLFGEFKTRAEELSGKNSAIKIHITRKKKQGEGVEEVDVSFEELLTDDPAFATIISNFKYPDDGDTSTVEDIKGLINAFFANDLYKLSMAPVIHHVTFDNDGCVVQFKVDLRTFSAFNEALKTQYVMNPGSTFATDLVRELDKLKERMFDSAMFESYVNVPYNQDADPPVPRWKDPAQFIYPIVGRNLTATSRKDEIIEFYNNITGAELTDADFHGDTIILNCIPVPKDPNQQCPVVLSVFFEPGAESPDIRATGFWPWCSWLETPLMQCAYEVMHQQYLKVIMPNEPSIKESGRSNTYGAWMAESLFRTFTGINFLQKTEKPIKVALFSGRRTGGALFNLLQVYLWNMFDTPGTPVKGGRNLGTSSFWALKTLKDLGHECQILPSGTHAHELSMTLNVLYGDELDIYDKGFVGSQVLGHLLYKELSAGKTATPMLTDTVGSFSFSNTATQLIDYQTSKPAFCSFTSARQDSGELEDYAMLMGFYADKAKCIRPALMASEIDERDKDFQKAIKVQYNKITDGQFDGYTLAGVGGALGDSEKIDAMLVFGMPFDKNIHFAASEAAKITRVWGGNRKSGYTLKTGDSYSKDKVTYDKKADPDITTELLARANRFQDFHKAALEEIKKSSGEGFISSLSLNKEELKVKQKKLEDLLKRIGTKGGSGGGAAVLPAAATAAASDAHVYTPTRDELIATATQLERDTMQKPGNDPGGLGTWGGGGRRTRRRARKVTKKYVRKNIRKSKNKKSRRSYRRKSKK